MLRPGTVRRHASGFITSVVWWAIARLRRERRGFDECLHDLQIFVLNVGVVGP